MKITLKIPALALLAALTVSCSLDQVREVNPGEAISFRSFSGGYTRAQSVDETTVGDIYVYAFKDGSLYFSDVFTNNSVDASGYWESDAPYYWPATQTGGTAPSLTFLAFNGDAMGADGTFMSAASFSMDAPPSGTSGVNVTDLTVPASIDDQIDLVVARAGNRTEANSANGVSLNFRHALSSIKVETRNDNPAMKVEVLGVRITYAHSKADFQFPTGDTDRRVGTDNGASPMDKSRWSAQEVPASFMARQASAVTLTTASGQYTGLLPSGQSFMLIPQEVGSWAEATPDNVRISILCRISEAGDPETSAGTADNWKQVFPPAADKYAFTSVAITASTSGGKQWCLTMM